MLGSWVRAPRGSPKGPSDHRRPLKIADFQRSFLFDPPHFAAKYWNIRCAWRVQRFRHLKLHPLGDIFHYYSAICIKRTLKTAAPSAWGRNGVLQVGLIHFQGTVRFAFRFFNAFAILLWSEYRVLKKGANRGCKPAKSDENQLSPPSFHSDIHLSSGNYSL